MPPTQDIYLEVGRRRVFAGALDWPGWCRSGRDESSALEALAAYGPRYAAALGGAAGGFSAPAGASALEVVERLEGNSTTDFGAPAVAPAADQRPLDNEEVERLMAILQACWASLDRAAESASGAVLRKGPRGGGRELDGIVRHVLEADRAYLSKLGSDYRKPPEAEVTVQMMGVREAFLHTVSSRARGEPPPRTRSALWSPRYSVRRSAWHALDHAWEIEDRSRP